MSARRDNWIMCRLPRTLHERLIYRAEAFQQQGMKGNTKVPYDPDAPYPALWRVIEELLERDLAHQVRARRQTKRNRRTSRDQEKKEAKGDSQRN